MHTTHLLAIVAMTSSFAIAAEPPTTLSETLVTKLINTRSVNRTPGIAVAVILEGSVKDGPFETNHVRRAVTIHPVVANGRSSRTVRNYDFHWNPTYGWFLWEVREDAAGQTIWIWSEHHGETVIR